MIEDLTGIRLIPGREGQECPGNGSDLWIECCCDECDYLLCCVDAHNEEECLMCNDLFCPRALEAKDEGGTI